MLSFTRQSWFDNLPIPKILLPLDMYRALASNEKNYAFCMNWEIKPKWGSEEHCEPLSSLDDQSGAEPLENLQFLAEN